MKRQYRDEAIHIVNGDAWSPYESRQIVRIRDAFHERGLAAVCEHGIADEGDPWVVFYELQSGLSVAHLTRDRGTYVFIWGDRRSIRASELGRFAEVIRASPLGMLR